MDNTSCEAQGGGEDCATESSDSGPDPLLLLPVLLSCVWVLFVSFYAPMLLGRFVKFIVNCFLKDSGIHIGMLVPVMARVVDHVKDMNTHTHILYCVHTHTYTHTHVHTHARTHAHTHTGALHVNILTGRVLFKDLQYYCRDYSVRCVYVCLWVVCASACEWEGANSGTISQCE